VVHVVERGDQLGQDPVVVVLRQPRQHGQADLLVRVAGQGQQVVHQVGVLVVLELLQAGQLHLGVTVLQRADGQVPGLVRDVVAQAVQHGPAYVLVAVGLHGPQPVERAV